MSLGNFELDIKRFVDKANGNVDLVLRKVALDLFKRVILKSPVKTGRFRSNWQVAINSIPSGTLGLSGRVSSGEAKKERSASAGDEALTRVIAAVPNAKAGDMIYLVNNLPYAVRLEYGHSKQAPAGMVRLSVAEYSSIVNKAASEVPQ